MRFAKPGFTYEIASYICGLTHDTYEMKHAGVLDEKIDSITTAVA